MHQPSRRALVPRAGLLRDQEPRRAGTTTTWNRGAVEHLRAAGGYGNRFRERSPGSLAQGVARRRVPPLELDAVVVGERPAHDLLQTLHPPRRPSPLAFVESRLPAPHRLPP